MKDLSQSIKVIILVLIIGFGLNIVYAWNVPSTTVIGASNVSTPVNTSSVSQYKIGGLGVGGVFVAYTGFRLGNNITAWSACPTNGVMGVDQTTGDLAVCVSGVWKIASSTPTN